MPVTIEREGPSGGDEAHVFVRDPSIGLRAVIAIHSTRRGPAFGGIRRWTYASEAEALADARALARAMSRKCALAGLPAGGAKTVMLHEAEADVAACYQALGEAVDALEGHYVCGPDVGTGPRELDALRSRTRWVNPASNDAGASTAQGVVAGMRAVFEALGLPQASGTRVAIMGLGAVGLDVARRLLARGVTVFGADVHASACDAAAAIGVHLVPPDRILTLECDVLAPCAMGGVFDETIAAALRCRAICGSANNQLADDRAALRLLERGIVHAPDVVVSAGAVIEGVLTVLEGTDEDVRRRVHAQIERLELVTGEILERARRERRPPTEVANARADAD